MSSQAWPFIRYNFLLFSHTFLFSCQNAISDLTAELTEMPVLTHIPVSSFLLQLEGICSTTWGETIKLPLHSQLSASGRAVLFMAIYVSIKSSGNTTTEKNKRPMSSWEKSWSLPLHSVLFSYQKLVARYGQEWVRHRTGHKVSRKWEVLSMQNVLIRGLEWKCSFS